MTDQTLKEKIKDILNQTQKCDCPCSGPFCNSVTHPHKEGCINKKDFVNQLLSLTQKYAREREKEIPCCGHPCCCRVVRAKFSEEGGK